MHLCITSTFSYFIFALVSFAFFIFVSICLKKLQVKYSLHLVVLFCCLHLVLIGTENSLPGETLMPFFFFAQSGKLGFLVLMEVWRGCQHLVPHYQYHKLIICQKQVTEFKIFININNFCLIFNSQLLMCLNTCLHIFSFLVISYLHWRCWLQLLLQLLL